MLWLVLLAPLSIGHAKESISDLIRVQLAWMHQSQFAGFYVAQVRKHFENQGLHVTLIEGGPNINPIVELQEGRADVAVSWLGNAWNLSTDKQHVTNIAQIFSGSSLAVLCRISAGVFTPKDITGKKIGVWNLGDETVVNEMLHLLDIPKSSVELVKQAPNGQDLIDGRVAYATAMTYNEYWQVLEKGITSTDLIVINPEIFGVPHIEDGLYVMTDRLNSPIFREQLVKLTKALRTG